MADPISWVVIAASAVSAIGAIQQGQAAKASANYNAAIADQNAQLSRQQAQANATQQARENYLRMGAIRAAQGHSGGEGGSGSVLDVIGDVAMQGELQKQNILYQGELQARGYGNTAALDRSQGKNAVTSSYFAAGSALLQGGANYYKISNSTISRSTPAPVESIDPYTGKRY